MAKKKKAAKKAARKPATRNPRKAAPDPNVTAKSMFDEIAWRTESDTRGR